MMKSGTNTIQRILKEVPHMDPEVRAALQKIYDGVFLELPEDPRVWVAAQKLLLVAIPADTAKQVEWHKRVIKIWEEETKTPHRCGKTHLKRVKTTTIGERCMQCAVCKDVWRIEYRANRVLGIYRNGVKQDVGEDTKVTTRGK